MFCCILVFVFVLFCVMVIVFFVYLMSNYCVSFKEICFEMCMSVGYDKIFLFENDFMEVE